jgi:hypothetical protein
MQDRKVCPKPDPANFRKIGEKFQKNRNSKKEEQNSESTEDHIKQISAQKRLPLQTETAKSRSQTQTAWKIQNPVQKLTSGRKSGSRN